MTVFVLGGGPAGLALVHELAGRVPAVLIERDTVFGGLARTVSWDDHGSHDLGPHKLYTRDDALKRRVESILPPEAWLTRVKTSRIFLRGRFLPYPPSPLALLDVFGSRVFAAMVRDYALSRLRGVAGRHRDPETFAAELTQRVGERLFRELFMPIAAKLWCDPEQLDARMARGRVQTPSLTELIARAAGLRSTSGFEALQFRYPRGGVGKLWDAIASGAAPDARILTGHEVTGLDLVDRSVRGVLTFDHTAGEERRFAVDDGDFVFSTLPLAALVRMLGPAVGPETAARLGRAAWNNDLYLCLFKIDRASLLDESWVFVPDPAIAFHRVSEQESFDPEMTPGGSIVCCEIMGTEASPARSWNDEELLAAAERGLRDMGYCGFTVEARRVIRCPASYPVLRAGGAALLESVLAELDALPNLRTIGRQGAENYIGTFDAMDIGFGAAGWLLAGEPRPSWQRERQRTQEYPVLD